MTPRVALAVAALVLAAAPAAAHSFEVTDVLLLVREDGTFEVDVTADVDALALGVSPTVPDAELVAALEAMTSGELAAATERARDTAARRIRVRVDGERLRPAVTFPGSDAPVPDPEGPPTVLGTSIRLRGRLPAGASEITVGASRAFGPVRFTVLDESTQGGTRVALAPGEDSPAWVLGAEAHAAPAADRRTVAGRYLVLGFEHIVPLGLDHILFVLGLYLLSTRLGPLLWQVSAFTIAHTTTLALSMYGVVSLPSRPVETLIALSIAYVALENVATSRLGWWRPLLVFGFGLLHGLGFAGVLRELGLPDGEYGTALVAFNVGVELGQLAVIGLAFVILGRFRARPWYRRRVVVPCSLAIALVGLWWAVERGLLGT